MSSAYFDETPEETMGADLGRAVRLLDSRREEAVREAGLHSDTTLVQGSRLARELAEFNREADEWSAEVVAPDGCLRVSTVGMREFVVEVEPGTARRHRVTTFCEIAGRVGSELIRERVRSTMQRRMEYARREQDARALGLL